jgi:hypothetical protein
LQTDRHSTQRTYTQGRQIDIEPDRHRKQTLRTKYKTTAKEAERQKKESFRENHRSLTDSQKRQKDRRRPTVRQTYLGGRQTAMEGRQSDEGLRLKINRWVENKQIKYT